MTIERKEVGPRMSQIVVHGNTVYLAGVVARDNAGKSVTDQTKEILATIDRYLAQAGSDKTKILSTNIWLADMGDVRRDECGVGRLGRARQHTGARNGRSEARDARAQGRDHGGRGEVGAFGYIEARALICHANTCTASACCRRTDVGSNRGATGTQK